MTLVSHRKGPRYGEVPEVECAELAAQILPTGSWMQQGEQPKKLPSWASFFATPSAMAIVVHPGSSEVERALVYGLHHAAGRHLHLILPADATTQEAIDATRRRVAFLTAPISVWTYDQDLHLTSCPELLPKEALVELRSETSQFKTDSIGAHESWVEALADRLADRGLVADRGRGIWYSSGARMVLLEEQTRRLRVTVGAAKGSIEPERFEVERGSAPQADMLDRIVARIDEDERSAWFVARPQQYAEHDLQGRITAGIIDLGWISTRLVREYPGRRATGRLGFIDFLGVDVAGDLHIVETKLGDQDEMLVLQGLDYWMWVQANRELLERDLDTTWREVRLDFVLAPKPGGRSDRRRNRYWDAVLRVIAPEIVCVITDVQTTSPTEAPGVDRDR